jgi:hypothetical protein
MNPRFNAFFALALVLVLARPALAGDEKCIGGAPGSKCGGPAAEAGPDEHDIRVKVDKEDAKGEFMCKQGKLVGDKVEYAKCAHGKLDKYDAVAIKKKIIAKEKYDKLDEKKRALVKKLAFYDSARKELKKELAELGEEKKEHIEYKKKKGALKMVDKQFDKSLGECAKEDKADFACPAKD